MQMRADIHRVFESVDVIVTPTTPIPAPKIADLKQKPELLRPHELLLLEKHASLQRVGRADHLHPLRAHQRRPSDRPADRRRSAARGSPPAVCLRLRTSPWLERKDARRPAHPFVKLHLAFVPSSRSAHRPAASARTYSPRLPACTKAYPGAESLPASRQGN